MLESRENSKKKNRANVLFAFGFCFFAPLPAVAQTSTSPSNVEIQQVKTANIQKSIVIGTGGIGQKRSIVQGTESLVDFPDASVNPATSNPNGSAAPHNTRTYSQEEIYGLIATESQKIGVDPQFSYIIADIESGFRQFIVSEKGAVGVMQLMPETAAELGVVNSYDAAQNIHGGISYLKKLLHEFGNPLMAAAAYHSGPQAVRNANGIPKGTRTAKYMVRILNDYYRISESNFSPSTDAPANTMSFVKPRPVIRKKARASKSRASAEPPVQEGSPASWDAGFVLHLE